MTPDTEIAILGAGCAGLSLAAALAVERTPGHVLLLEPRMAYTRDRTWCFWNTEEHPFTSEISHSWHSWRVSHEGAAATVRSRRYRYCHIAGDAFYRAATDRVEDAANQDLCRGITVHSVAPHGRGLVAVETSNGRLLARHVFDSRPISENATAPVLLQRFLGRHVRTDRPCFDPDTVELMRFLPSDAPGRMRFVYVLPFSPTEALVEMTYLDDPLLPEPAFERDLEEWLAEHAREWTVLYEERGTLPMGGRVKPSSGYAFLRIQRHSRALARALRMRHPLPSIAEGRLYGMMDAVFLRALKRSPATAPGLFLRMFAGADADALVRFLSEASGPAEMLRVALSLPKLPLMRAAVLSARHGLSGSSWPTAKSEAAV